MNILFVTGVFAKNKWDTALSGMPCAVYKSAIGMLQRGHRVRVVTIDDMDKQWNYQGIEVISIKARHGHEEKHVFKSILCVLQRECRIEKKIKELDKEASIDIIQYVGWFGIGLLHFSRIPAVMRVSSYTKVQPELLYNYNIAQRCLIRIVEYLAAQRMNYIFAPSKIMADGVQKDLKKKVSVIETPFLQEKIEWEYSLLKSKIKDRRYILFFGRMSVEKGILVVKDIMYRVLKKYSDICFVFAGDSWKHNGIDIETELIDAAREYGTRVLCLGNLQKKKLFPIIYNAEMILMPSLADNFPNSCAEAMALGKIVIGSNGSSLEQFITNKRNGFLAEAGSAESLYRCIEYVFNMNEVQKERMSINAQKRIKLLDLKHYSTRMEVLYNKIIEKTDLQS